MSKSKPIDVDDELIIQDHPHADQRNWWPGADDDDTNKNRRLHLTDRGALRTLKRLRELTRVPPEAFVEAIYGGIERAIEAMGIKPRLRMDQIPGFTVAQIVEASLYLQRVAACIDERMREGQWKCVECGQVVWAKIDLTATAKDALTMEVRHVRRDAHYCSQACRAKASRKRKRKGKRVTAKASDTAAKPSRVTALASRRAA